jgi:stress-induced morphogen
MLPSAGGCGDFYAIIIASDEFKGLSTIKQHKLVNSALAEEIKNIHGLQVPSFNPGFVLLLT